MALKTFTEMKPIIISSICLRFSWLQSQREFFLSVCSPSLYTSPGSAPSSGNGWPACLASAPPQVGQRSDQPSELFPETLLEKQLRCNTCNKSLRKYFKKWGKVKWVTYSISSRTGSYTKMRINQTYSHAAVCLHVLVECSLHAHCPYWCHTSGDWVKWCTIKINLKLIINNHWAHDGLQCSKRL